MEMENAGGIALRSRRDGVTPLGNQLRAERERRGEILEKISEATKIRKTYLEALESHDWKALPADVFTRGYLRSYAEYLGLDQEHLLKVYARERRIAGDGTSTTERAQDDAAKAILKRLAQTHGVKTRRNGTRTKWIVLGLSGAGVAALAVWIFLQPLGRSRGESTAIEVPSYAVASPPRKGVNDGVQEPPGHFSDVAPAAKPLPTPPAEPPKDLSAVAPAAKPLPTPPAEPPARTEALSTSHLNVDDFGVGTDVVNHRLVGRADRFREGTVVSFWTSVLGGRPGDKIRHVWMHGGQSVAVTELSVNAAQWRTQSRRLLPEGSTGDWTVEARDPDDHVIASVGFTCVAAE